MLFLDSSVPDEVTTIFDWGVVCGVTTNPLIIARELGAIDLETCIREIVARSTGPVSVELTTETPEAMLDEALGYHAWAPDRICIKVPFSEVGLQVIHKLAGREIATNATCMMNFSQLYLAALAGATYVSLFSGRIRDMGYEPGPIITETRAILDREGSPAKIIVGSIRHVADVVAALQHGAHIVTVPPAIIRKMIWNPRTESTIREFNEAWKNRSQKE
ncbi:MAG: transaldolase [Polyangiaceae bacterium]|nr:transaldolase [Polyangiaceae bacterium]